MSATNQFCAKRSTTGFDERRLGRDVSARKLRYVCRTRDKASISSPGRYVFVDHALAAALDAEAKAG